MIPPCCCRDPVTPAPPPVVAATVPSIARAQRAHVSIPTLNTPAPTAQASIPVPLNSAEPLYVRITNMSLSVRTCGTAVWLRLLRVELLHD